VAQTRTVAERITRTTGIEIELVTVTTHGDTSEASLQALGGTGVFASALRESLLRDDCDLLVHSFKDLPTAKQPGIVVGAVPKRADARDALCARDGLDLAGLPEGATVGTGSPRRVAQLRRSRPDITVQDIRGNVDTRLAMVTDARLDAVILAAAGLQRLGRAESVTESFPLSAWPTAAAQGALAIETREGDARGELSAALAAVNHVTSRATATAERAVLAGLEAGCAAPVGVSALVEDGLFFVSATVYAPDGSQRLTSSHAVSLEGAAQHALLSAGAEAAERVVAELLADGAADLAPMGSES
jgi:hydroxymethylbilane synthase